MQRYVPPESPSILVLLPCSAKKPYSISRTHRMFRRVIRDSGISSAVHEVIITSPLGIVPRELETVYPAQQYDIPVTGHWDEDEKKMAIGMLSHLLSTKQYSKIIAHIDLEMSFLNDFLRDFNTIHTGGDDATYKENLKNLEGRLRSLGEEIERPSWTKRTYDDMRALASYQFGEAGCTLFEESNVKGAYPHIKIFRNNVQLCSYVIDKGGFSLTIDGGRALSRSGQYGVEIEDFMPKTNIFAIGIKNATPDIRIGDEVYVYNSGEIRAVGTARMNWREMINMSRGEAVHIRHHS